jgi:hypothetical protein
MIRCARAALHTPDRNLLISFWMVARPGTTDALLNVGVRDSSARAARAFPDMPLVSKGWSATSAFFKGEGERINIGLGRGTALDIFNEGLTDFEKLR